jgi:hypothetical protein
MQDSEHALSITNFHHNHFNQKNKTYGSRSCKNSAYLMGDSDNSEETGKDINDNIIDVCNITAEYSRCAPYRKESAVVLLADPKPLRLHTLSHNGKKPRINTPVHKLDLKI